MKAARPLVLVARAPAQSLAFARILKRAELDVTAKAVIRMAPPASWRGLDSALKNLADFDAAAFSSANAVDALFARARRLGLRKPRLPKFILAVGPATAQALKRRGLRACLVAANPGGKNLAHLVKNARGLIVLAPRAENGKEDLVRALRKKGALVRAVDAYRTLADRRHEKALRRAALEKKFAAAAFFSGSAVRAFRLQVGRQAWNALRQDCLFAALGATAAKALRRLGARKILQPARADADDLARLLSRALLSRFLS